MCQPGHSEAMMPPNMDLFWLPHVCQPYGNESHFQITTTKTKQKEKKAIPKSRLRKNIVHRLSAKSFLLFFSCPLWLVWDILTWLSEAGTAEKKMNWILRRKHISQKAFTFLSSFSHPHEHTPKMGFSKCALTLLGHILFRKHFGPIYL